MKKIPRIFITPGEPAGIGPDVTIRIAQHAWPAELIVVADPELLQARAQQLQLPLQLIPANLQHVSLTHPAGTLKLIPVPLKTLCKVGELNPLNANYVLQCLELATDYCLQNKGDALVTGPVHKGIMNEAGVRFLGHTEYLAERCKVPQTVMLFVTRQFKVALATTHLPLAQVPRAITCEKLITTLEVLHHALRKQFMLSHPKILVCGLNPHAGEKGYLGSEEIHVIGPAIHQLRAKKLDILGPLPADTIFTEKYLKSADAILAMYHDQALPVVKYMGFNHAINVTLGLPIIRTSVDHGTALDIAGTSSAHPGSLAAAIRLAIKLIRSRTTSD